MKRKTVVAGFAGVSVLWMGILSPAAVMSLVDGRAFSLVVLYTAVLVLARYSPAICTHRVHVLKAPEKHIPIELRKARDFGAYVSERLLFAGLIFTLVNVAKALAMGSDAVESGALAMSLTSALYALIMYWVVARRTAAVRAL